MNIVLFGGPGSGKGTQAEQLSREFELKHISTGDLFRENLKNQTDLGKLAKTFMDRGELVSDDITEAMVEERLARPDTATGIILDGFPRTLAQAEALTEIMAHLNRQIDGVLYLKVSDAEIVRRLSGRLICRNCQTPFHKEFNPPSQAGICDVCGGELYQRDDDNPETIRAQLKTFHRQTAPLINYYREAGLLIEIDGEGDVSQVSQRMSEALRR
ncbi:MAG TPA: adenylate kinase [Anaerolineae bacterium]